VQADRLKAAAECRKACVHDVTHDPKSGSNALSPRDLVVHLRHYGYRHFDSSADYYEWFSQRLGKQAAKIERMRENCSRSPSPLRDREFMDFVAAPPIRGVVGSIQTDDIAQATWLIGEALGTAHNVLDLGCGTGEAATWFARLGVASREVLGVDFSPKSITAARERALKLGVKNARFEVGDFAQSIPTGPFDAVVDMAALQYAMDPGAALQRVCQALGENGVLIAAPMLGRVREIESYLSWVAAAGLRLQRFDWVLARDLGRNVARPLVVASTVGEPLEVDVSSEFQTVATRLRLGRVTPLSELAALSTE
jgi:SAM-dependent methyltransferase